MVPLKEDTIFCLSFDVEKANTKSGFKPAKTGFNDKKELFGDLRLKGFAALLKEGFAKHIIIVGGNEARYANENPAINRAQAIKEMLVHEYNVHPDKISCIVSQPHTVGNILAIKTYISEKNISPSTCAAITSFWHIPRVSLDLADYQIPMVMYPAEAFYFLENTEKKSELVKELGNNVLAKRIAEEIVGISDKIQGTYQQK